MTPHPRPHVPQTIGGRIRWERRVVGMTASRLAALSGLTRQALCEIEADRQRVTATELVRLAGVLHISTDRLCGRFPLSSSGEATSAAA